MKNYCVTKVYQERPPEHWENLSEEEACKIATSLRKEWEKGTVSIEQMIRCQRCKQLTDWKVTKKYCLTCSRALTNERQRKAQKKAAASQI